MQVHIQTCDSLLHSNLKIIGHKCVDTLYIFLNPSVKSERRQLVKKMKEDFDCE